MPNGYLCLVLHAHLPYVRHPEYERFLEERWFFEAITETYIPLIKFFDRLRAEGVKAKMTLSVSPTLANMMEDPLLQQRYLRHLEMSIRLAERELERTRHWPHMHFLAGMYKALFEEARLVFEQRCEMRLVKAFKEFEEAGYLELITCAATHGFLPALIAEPETVRAQIQISIREHERIFGKKPKGLWVPECAWFPGLDVVIAEAGIKFFFVDSHGIEHAEPRPQFGVHAPLFCPSGVAAFGRHPATSKLVWSDKVGYPGDTNYREYFRDIGLELDANYLEEFQSAKGIRSPTGIKYHKITGKGSDKHLYEPDRARETAEMHARDFVNRCRDQANRASPGMPLPAILVSPYDAELFGHWWFEGPQWIYYVLKEIARGDGQFATTTPSEYLKTHPIQQKAVPGPSSWGKNGYSEHWINPKTDWMWRPLHEAGARMTKIAGANPSPASRLDDRALKQAARELLLAQSSDWPFIITNGTTEQYARRRFNDHLKRFHYILDGFDRKQIDENRLAALEHMDAIFPELDYRVFASRS